MQIFPNIKRLKLKSFSKSKREKYNSFITQNKYTKQIKSYNDLPVLISSSSITIPNNSVSFENNKNKYNNNNSSLIFTSEKRKTIYNRNFKNQIKIIKCPTQKLHAEKEINYNTLELNNKYKDTKLFSTNRENMNNLSNITYSKTKNLNKSKEDINYFLYPNNKTFEYMQNLINKKIAINKEISKNNNIIYQKLGNKKMPVNNYNSELIIRFIIKNTFNEALKKALLNKALINKNDIKEEYQKPINGITIHLNLNDREKKDLNNNLSLESLSVNKYYIPLDTNINNNKKMKLNILGRNRKFIQNNSCDNIFFNQKKYNKELFGFKNINIDCKRNELEKNGTLISLLANNNNLYKGSSALNINNVIMKNKINLNISGLKKTNKKQKISIDDNIKLKSLNTKTEDNVIKIENSVQKNITTFHFLSNNKSKNKNEDIVNYINDNEKSIKFDNSLTEEKIEKSLLKRTLFDKKVGIIKNLFNDIDKNKKSKIAINKRK